MRIFTQGSAFAVAFALTTFVAQAAPLQFQVTIDTSSIGGTGGSLDIQFNPGLPPSDAATATVSTFAPVANIGGAPAVIGDVSGDLTTTLALTNSTPFNDYFQAFTYGSRISFLLTIS